jgi:uncharacterized Fe-S cluster protein YjdI/CDGSH-type Zn-finger protein
VPTRTYTAGDITVFWDAPRCIHTGICLRTLPAVFNLRQRPWVQLDKASVDAIVDAVELCPTGALRYERDGKPEPTPAETTLVRIPNGPLLVRGHVRILDDADGEVVAEENRVALCRCGKSENQPFCDNAHRRIRFDEHAPAPVAGAAAEAESPADICPPQDFDANSGGA